MKNESTALVIEEAKTPEQKNAVDEYKSLPELQGLLLLINRGKKILVTSADQIELIAEAKETKRKLQKARIAIDARRKELKADILLKGKAIDGMANVFNAMIVPVENSLENQAKFVERIEEKRLKNIEDIRIAELSVHINDVSFYNLRDMSEEGFRQLLESGRIAHEAMMEAERRAKEEADEEKKAHEEEQERICKENAKLKAEAEERIRKEKEELEAHEKEKAEVEALLAAEREATKKATEEAQKLKDEQKRKEHETKEKVEAEEKDKKLAEEKAKRAPDKDKLHALAISIIAIELPKVKSADAKKTITDVTELLNKTSNFIKKRIAEM